MNEYILAFKRYFDFKGRSTRSEFWYFTAFNLLLVLAMLGLDVILFGNAGVFYTIAILATIIPSIAVSIRRLHDIGRTGWWLLLNLIPILSLVLIFFYVQPTNPNNKY